MKKHKILNREENCPAFATIFANNYGIREHISLMFIRLKLYDLKYLMSSLEIYLEEQCEKENE